MLIDKTGQQHVVIAYNNNNNNVILLYANFYIAQSFLK